MLKKELEAIIEKQSISIHELEGEIDSLEAVKQNLEAVVSTQRGDMLDEDDNSDSIIKSLKDQMRDIQMEKESTAAWRNVWVALLIVSVTLHFFI